MSLVDAFDDQPRSRPLEFAARVFLDTIPSEGRSEAEKKQREWLTELSTLVAGQTSVEHCDMMEETTWFHDDTMNLLERGISRLYTALHCLLTGNMEEYRRQVISAVTMLAERFQSNPNWDEATLERAIEVFSRMEDEKEK